MITPEQAQEAYKKYGSKRSAARELGIPRSTFRRKLGNVDKKDIADEYEKIEKSFGQDSGTVTTKSFLIKTVEDALRYADVDMEIWEVDRYTINSWQVTMKGPETHTNFQIKVWLKKKVEEKVEIALNNLIDRLAHKIEFTPSKVSKSKSVLVVPGLVDHHFGLLAWGRETGNDYDLKIAEDLYVKGMDKGIDAVKDYEIAQFMLPVGSDFFHINAPDNRTPKGNNPLDVDSRLAKVFEVGFYSVIKAVERARQIAPVEIKWIPGNHDPETSFYLCKVIEAYYRNADDVTVDTAPTWRKFYKWHNTLLGMCHGDEEPHQRLPTIMADSCPIEWGQCKFKEWLVGHIHKKKQMNFVGIDSFGSTIIRFMPSLCRIDQWHYKKGFVGGNKSMEILAYDEKGLKGYFPIYI
jgi:hypothetical protein